LKLHIFKRVKLKKKTRSKDIQFTPPAAFMQHLIKVVTTKIPTLMQKASKLKQPNRKSEDIFFLKKAS